MAALLGIGIGEARVHYVLPWHALLLTGAIVAMMEASRGLLGLLMQGRANFLGGLFSTSQQLR